MEFLLCVRPYAKLQNMALIRTMSFSVWIFHCREHCGGKPQGLGVKTRPSQEAILCNICGIIQLLLCPHVL